MYSSSYIDQIVQSGDVNIPPDFNPTATPYVNAVGMPSVSCPLGSSIVGGVCQSPISMPAAASSAAQAARALQSVSATAPYVQQPLTRPASPVAMPAITTGTTMNTTQYLLIMMVVLGIFMVTNSQK